MTIAVHLVNTPKDDAREAYETAWRRIDEQGVRHPKGRQSHTAWIVDDVLHVLDVWDSENDLQQWMQTLAPILQDANMELAETPRPASCCKSSGPTDRHHPCRSASPSPPSVNSRSRRVYLGPVWVGAASIRPSATTC